MARDEVQQDSTDGGSIAAVPRPFIPDRAPGERPILLPSQRPERRSEPEPDAQPAERTTGFQFQPPLSDILLRWLVVLVPLALGIIAGLLGVEFQKYAESFTDAGVTTDTPRHLHAVRELTAILGAIGVVGLMVMAMWSGLMVTNANRVGFSLRTPWFASVGWLLAPSLGLVAHFTIDKRLDSGSLAGVIVFLAFLYLPFGTLGGAAEDLGGSAQLARTWFLASVIGAFLLIVGMSGATSVLPVDDLQNQLRARAFSCYLAGLMLCVSSAVALATAVNLNALIRHRWARLLDPEGAFNDPSRNKIRRSGRKLRRRLTPTLFLRVLVTAGLFSTGVASVAVLFVFRGRHLNSGITPSERQLALDDFRTMLIVIGAVSVAVHFAYAVWAVVAARNAYRRSILAPNPWAVVGAFSIGPIFIAIGALLTGPFGAAVLTIGLILAVAGFVVGQLVLGRTVSALGGNGRIFLEWMILDFGFALFAAFISANSTNRIQIVAFGVAQTAMAILGAALAWVAMTRLDRTCREYRHSGGTSTDLLEPSILAGISGQVPVITSAALTSSQS